MIADPPGSWDAMPPDEQQRIMEGHRTFAEALVAEKKMAGGFRLRPIGDAKTLRRRGVEGEVTDGPFAETKEVLGGFYVIEAASMDEALAWARRIPMGVGSIEVRPLWS
jgi:hypothetical protein